MLSEIKKGFLIGLGLIIPFGLMELATIKISYMSNSVEEQFPVENPFRFRIDSVDLSEINTQKQGKEILIRGSVKNIGKEMLSSIGIQAEFFDSENNFVYECDKYLSEEVHPGQSVNYLMKCGCKENGLPSYTTITMGVTSATSY